VVGLVGREGELCVFAMKSDAGIAYGGCDLVFFYFLKRRFELVARPWG